MRVTRKLFLCGVTKAVARSGTDTFSSYLLTLWRATLLCLLLTAAGLSQAQTDVSSQGECADTLSWTDTARAPLDVARQDFIKDELRTLRADEHIKAALPCGLTVVFTSPSEDIAAEFGATSFYVRRTETGYAVQARSSLGHLYGFYEVLTDLGLIFASADTTLLTTKGVGQLGVITTPKIKTRGTYSFAREGLSETLDPAFLLWAGRNRFNLAGGDFGRAEPLREIFGIGRMGGGHDVISRLAAGDHVENGQRRDRAHPAWYGVRPWYKFTRHKNPIPFGQDSYINPCFGNAEFAAFFAKALEAELIGGRYADVDILNLWPSDSPVFATGPYCQRAPGSTSPTEDLMFFYAEIMRHLSGSDALKNAGRQVTIAGISYYGTYDLTAVNPRFRPGSAGGNSVDYLHIFYQNVRSYQSPLFTDDAVSINRSLAKMMTESRAALGGDGAGFGVTEYFNYSIYRSVVSPQSTILNADLDAYADQGATLYMYMHPNTVPGPFQMALDYGLSRRLAADEAVAHAQARFATAYWGHDNGPEVFERYAAAIANQAEIFGPESSLWLFQIADQVWKRPPLARGDVIPYSTKIIDGTTSNLPSVRLPDWPPRRFEGQGLTESLDALDALLSDVSALLSEAKDAQTTTRRRLVYDEIKRSRAVFSLPLYMARIREAAVREDKFKCQSALDDFQTALGDLKALDWPQRLVPFSDKASVTADLEAMYTAHLAPRCAAI